MRKAILVLTLLILSGARADAAARLTVHPELTTTDFAARWSWAEAQARGEGLRARIGYSIDRWMEPDQYFFSGNVTLHRDGNIVVKGRSLEDILSDLVPASGASGVINPKRPGTIRKPIAVLVEISPEGDIVDVNTVDFAFPAGRESLPLVWIGPASADESFGLLTGLYAKAKLVRAKEDLIEAVGYHDRAEAVSFLARVLDAPGTDKVRREAAESLAEQSTARATIILVRIARNDSSIRVREEAVEALGESRLPQAEQALHDLVAGTLEDIVYEDENVSVREEALEALGELKGGEGLAALVKVARTHPDAAMREEALDSLVDASEDQPRALRALEMLGAS